MEKKENLEEKPQKKSALNHPYVCSAFLLRGIYENMALLPQSW